MRSYSRRYLATCDNAVK